MKRNCLLVLIFAGLLCLMLSGCGNKDALLVYNWGDYIDPDVLDRFEADTGIHVKYTTFETNEDMYTKISSGGASYDLLIPSDYMIERMINEGLLAELDYDNIPNARYTDETLLNADFDPDNKYSVPYMWGTVGICYNTTKVTETVDSWNILWDPKYEQDIFMLDSPRDSLGVTLKLLGYSMNSHETSELEAAKAKLTEQKPLVKAYLVDEVKDQMIAGDAALAVVWSGDYMYMYEENPDLAYAVPKEGSNYWIDSMVIPADAAHKAEAEAFINYMCDPEIALMNTLYIGYSTPNTETYKLLPAEIRENKAAYPDDSVVENCEVFRDPGDFISEYNRIWTELTAQ